MAPRGRGASVLCDQSAADALASRWVWVSSRSGSTGGDGVGPRALLAVSRCAEDPQEERPKRVRGPTCEREALCRNASYSVLRRGGLGTAIARMTFVKDSTGVVSVLRDWPAPSRSAGTALSVLALQGMVVRWSNRPIWQTGCRARTHRLRAIGLTPERVSRKSHDFNSNWTGYPTITGA
jgi:hypothetical protein